MSVTFKFHIYFTFKQLASKLASYRWACGSAGPNQSQVNEAITELWVSYSIKNAILNIWQTSPEWPDMTDDRIAAN